MTQLIAAVQRAFTSESKKVMEPQFVLKYKVTDENNYTMNNTKWGENISSYSMGSFNHRHHAKKEY